MKESTLMLPPFLYIHETSVQDTQIGTSARSHLYHLTGHTFIAIGAHILSDMRQLDIKSMLTNVPVLDVGSGIC